MPLVYFVGGRMWRTYCAIVGQLRDSGVALVLFKYVRNEFRLLSVQNTFNMLLHLVVEARNRNGHLLKHVAETTIQRASQG